MASTKYNVVYRSGAAVNSPVPSYYTCGTVAEISGAVAGDLAYETTNNRVMKYSGSAWEFMVPNPPFARTDVQNIFTDKQWIQSTTPRLNLLDSSQPANAKIFQLVNASQQLYIQALNDAENTSLGYVFVARNGNFSASADIYEKQRTTPIGHWIAVPYSAANFTTNGGMTWTVPSGSILTQAYTLVGKTITYQFYAINTVLGGSANTELRIAIPFTINQYGTSFCWYDISSAVPGSMCLAHAASGTSYISLYQLNTSTSWTLGNYYQMGFTISFQIN